MIVIHRYSRWWHSQLQLLAIRMIYVMVFHHGDQSCECSCIFQFHSVITSTVANTLSQGLNIWGGANIMAAKNISVGTSVGILEHRGFYHRSSNIYIYIYICSSGYILFLNDPFTFTLPSPQFYPSTPKRYILYIYLLHCTYKMCGLWNRNCYMKLIHRDAINMHFGGISLES